MRNMSNTRALFCASLAAATFLLVHHSSWGQNRRVYYGYVPAEKHMGETLPNADFSNRSVSLFDFSSANLQGANFRNSDLTMTKFHAADLRGANFTGARIDRIELNGADLRGIVGWRAADLGLGIIAQRANFSGTDLSGGMLIGGYSGGYFEEADFSNANLNGATLAGRFHNAKFDGANVQDALMIGADGLESLHTELTQRGAIATPQDFAKAVENQRTFSNALLRGAQLMKLDLAGAQLNGADLHSANLQGALLDRSNLQGTELYWAKAEGSQLRGADLSKAVLSSATFTNADFSSARLGGATLHGTRLAGANFQKADLSRADFTGADLTGADFTGAILTGIIVDAAVLDQVKGLQPEELQSLQSRSGRWWYDLADGTATFLRNWALPSHILLVTYLTVWGIAGLRGPQGKRSFFGLTAINLLSAFPLLSAVTLGLIGGSPTAQMSDVSLWMLWFRLWPMLLLGTGGLLLVSLGWGAVHLFRHALWQPRRSLAASLNCALLTPVNCFFALALLMQMAPDA